MGEEHGDGDDSYIALMLRLRYFVVDYVDIDVGYDLEDCFWPFCIETIVFVLILSLLFLILVVVFLVLLFLLFHLVFFYLVVENDSNSYFAKSPTILKQSKNAVFFCFFLSFNSRGILLRFSIDIVVSP